MSALIKTVEKLCEASRKVYPDLRDSYETIAWPSAIDHSSYYFSPELMSLAQTKFLDELDESARQRLSFFEAVNFFSLNIHGEQALMREVRQHMNRGQSEITPYLQHLLDEENTHMMCFSKFCMRYAGKIYANRAIPFPRRKFTPEQEDFLGFARILIFEEIVDAYNQAMASDERLVPIARQINRLHHRDEIRHLAFGREVTSVLFKKVVLTSDASELAVLRAYLNDYIQLTWRTYYNHHAYQDADPSLSIDQAITLSETAFHSAAAKAHRQRLSHRLVAYLFRAAIMEAVPAL
jgi:hypothetical protein